MAIYVEDQAFVCKKETLEKKKAQKQTKKKFSITMKAKMKKLLEATLAENMNAQSDKERELFVMKLAPHYQLSGF